MTTAKFRKTRKSWSNFECKKGGHKEIAQKACKIADTICNILINSIHENVIYSQMNDHCDGTNYPKFKEFHYSIISK